VGSAPRVAGETDFTPRPLPRRMVEVDPVLVALIVLMLLFVLGVYFMLRRTLLAFTEGMREGQNKR